MPSGKAEDSNYYGMIRPRVEDEVMRVSFRRTAAFLAFGTFCLSAVAQEAEIKKVGEAVQKAVVRMRRSTTGASC